VETEAAIVVAAVAIASAVGVATSPVTIATTSNAEGVAPTAVAEEEIVATAVAEEEIVAAATNATLLPPVGSPTLAMRRAALRQLPMACSIAHIVRPR